MLLEFGAEKTIENRRGQTPWDLAGDDDIVSEVFRNHSDGIYKKCFISK